MVEEICPAYTISLDFFSGEWVLLNRYPNRVEFKKKFYL